MPYGRYRTKRFRGRFRGRRRNAGSFGGNAMSLARAAWRGFKFVKGIINSEKKTLSIAAIDNAAISTTGSVVHLSQIAQGDDYVNREGRSVLAKSIQVTGYHTMNASATSTGVRYILFIDVDNGDGTPPTVAQVLQATASVRSLRNDNPIFMKRFKVLVDKTYFLDQVGKGLTSKLNLYAKLNHHIKFSTSTIASQGGVYLLSISTEATNTPTANIMARLRFYDN